MMDNKIISDSSVDFKENRECVIEGLEIVPFKVLIDDEEIVDIDLKTEDLIKKMKASNNQIKTACPSPGEFYEAFAKEGASFVVTISAALSGSFNSAVLAKNMLLDKIPDALVHIFDTRSACSAVNLVILKIKELITENMKFDEIVNAVNKYISKMKTLFILDSLDNLVKNGRISNLKAMLASFLHIVPIMGENGKGEIVLHEQVRGNKKAFNRLVDIIGESGVDFENTVLGITHSNAKEKAENLKNEILKRFKFKDVLIFAAGGLSTVYADDGGIVVAF
jgi:DegV family protein with EDD domain